MIFIIALTKRELQAPNLTEHRLKGLRRFGETEKFNSDNLSSIDRQTKAKRKGSNSSCEGLENWLEKKKQHSVFYLKGTDPDS